MAEPQQAEKRGRMKDLGAATKEKAGIGSSDWRLVRRFDAFELGGKQLVWNKLLRR